MWTSGRQAMGILRCSRQAVGVWKHRRQWVSGGAGGQLHVDIRKVSYGYLEVQVASCMWISGRYLEQAACGKHCTSFQIMSGGAGGNL